ncbi:MAG: ATP-binding protein [Alphaproteobacteria bacterium]|nr:ATP-binding protein [Alphaproteobacteria bacterium]
MPLDKASSGDTLESPVSANPGLARRLVLYIVLASSSITLIITSIQLYLEYRSGVSALESRLALIKEISHESLESALWETNQRLAQVQLDGIAKLPDIQYVVIREASDIWVEAGRDAEERVLRTAHPLVIVNRGTEQLLGEFEVVATLDGVYGHLIDQAVTILLSNGVKTFLVAGFMLLLFQRLVVRHIVGLRDFAGSLKLGEEAGTVPSLSGHRPFPNELDDLGGTLVSMHRDLNASYRHSEFGRRRLELILEAIDEGVMLTDRKGVIQDFNANAGRIFGRAPDALSGTTLTDLIDLDPEQGHTGEEGVAAFLNGSRRGTGHRAGGTDFPLSISCAPLSAPGFEGYVATLSDITEAEAREQALTDAIRKLEEANHAKSHFLATMSHELRTPLNAIIGFSELLKHESFGPLGSDRYIEYSGDIHEAGHHLLGIINDVLDLSSIEAGTLSLSLSMQRTDIAEVVEKAARYLKPQIDAQEIDLVIENTERDCCVTGDPLRLRQVLINLLSNAVKFNHEGGRITVHISTSDGYRILSVSDTGIGIPPDRLIDVTLPFQQVAATLTREYGGAGLGLPIAKHIVEMHNGQLEIESQLGKGTTVSIALPVAA